tara:strand:- start:3696 stop:4616 length:921 start_codon:yes stop_codon:yes gene_type:complete
VRKILLIGSSGFLGKNVFDKINKENEVHIIAGKKDCDVSNIDELRSCTVDLDFDYIINCAAFVGGIAYGYKYPAEMLAINSKISNNVYEVAKEKSVKMLVNPIPNCVYPGHLDTYKEENLWEGPPHESVFYYALAKRMSIALGSSYHAQYNLSSSSVIMSNMYGPNDHFEENRSHAMGALINKIYTAKLKNEKTVDVWGSGNQIREWLYVEDGADALIKCMDLSDGNYLFNIGVGKGISIIDLANLIKDYVGWDGEFILDTTKPEGVLEKKVDGSMGKDTINWSPKFNLDDGVKRTVEWYGENYGQ